MSEYRVTKYNPALRNDKGAYTVDEWTAVSDIGREFNGVVLTAGEYRRVEQAYIDSALAFLKEGGIASLRVEGLENYQHLTLPVEEGSIVPLDQVGDLIGQILREEFWCRLEGLGGVVHFGHDYCMYIGVPHRCAAAERLAETLGLYVEEFASPCHEES